MNAAAVLVAHPVVLLDFDGPVCDLFAAIDADTIAAELVDLVAGQDITVPPEHRGGPHDVLSFAATCGTSIATLVEQHLARREIPAARLAEPAEGAAELLGKWRSESRRVALVSNNNAEAVRTYLERLDLADAFPVIGRDPSDPALMKPNPHLLYLALGQLDASSAEAVLIGDSITDIEAAHNAGTASIAYANKPGKRDRLAAQRPNAIITTMNELFATPSSY